ncbi:MAG: glycerophosphodiester phosphodiesterase, partial [Clostridia bacterium]|nr:glycerophosphodiester phosphodiesterase [Clostridia bacterium]
FDPRALHAVRKLRPGICLGQLAANFFKDKTPLPVWQKAVLSNLALNFLFVPDFIAYKFEDSRSPALQACLKLWGTQEVSWTIRSRKDLDACEALGSIPIFEQFDPDL